MFTILKQWMWCVRSQLAKRLLLIGSFEGDVTLERMHIVMTCITTGHRLKHRDVDTASILAWTGRSIVHVTSDLALSSFNDDLFFIGKHCRDTVANPSDEILVF